MEAVPSSVDLDAYVARIGYAGDLRPTRAVLQRLHRAHATHIPFENLDILLGRPIRLDLESLQAKLVHRKRGGYCFEQNELLAAVLEHLGFAVTRLAARVRVGANRVSPRTHMLLRVDVEGTPWLADVGFGGAGILEPVPLAPGQEAHQDAWAYRVTESAGLWVLQSLDRGDWHDLYAFTMEPQHPVDYEVANYYVSTHPDSIFVRQVTAQRPSPEARYILRGRELTTQRPGSETSRTIVDNEELLQVLAETFGLVFPRGTRFVADDQIQRPPRSER
jgi:N-hydroxyarylamine O-acetyltransferase